VGSIPITRSTLALADANNLLEILSQWAKSDNGGTPIGK
jgi:hypothetical protein